ncbi:MAG TPA: ABC transporter substrate-binding protein [Candidatus Binatia bacterium]|nr:ABC transporter substrate-binding protein [Candidatus Binatia bacterium]
MKQKVIWDGLVFGAVLFLLSGALEVRSARGEEKILVAYAGHSESVAHMWVGIEKGLFKKYGLDVRMLQVRSGPLIAATLASGSVQVVWTAPSSILSAASAGLKVSCLASTTNILPRELVVQKEIRTFDELRGRVFGVQSIGGGLWLQTMVVLETLGIDPEAYHLRMRVIGDIPTVAQALMSGNIDAAVLPNSFSDLAKRSGAISLGGQLIVPFQSNVLCSSRDFVAKSPDLATRLIQGMIEAVLVIYDPSHREDVQGILKRNLRFSKAEDAEASYKVLRAMNNLDVAPHAEGWRTIQRLVSRVNPKVGQINLEEVLYPRLVQGLEERGFISEMRKKLIQ